MEVKKFQKVFVGNPSIYSYCKKNGEWNFAKKGRITLELIEKHLKKEITLGSYYAYKQSHNREYCRWICLDFDLHPLILEGGIIFDNSKKIKSIKFPIKLYDERKKKIKDKAFGNEEELLEYYWQKSGIIVHEIIEHENKQLKKEKYRIEANELNKLDKFTKEIRKFLINFCKIPKIEICREISGRGYHIWIFLKNLTTLKRAYNYTQYLNEKVKIFFGVECEIFPKQEEINEGIGNFVKLPLSINRKNNIECVILDNFNLSNVKGFEIDSIISKIRKDTVIEKDTLRYRKRIDLTKWTPLELGKNEFYEKLRPCLKKIVKKGEYGDHYIRIQIANELFKLKAPLSVRINAFTRQKDFDYKITRYQCIDLEMRARKYNNFFIAGCPRIAEKNWCLPNCPELHKNKGKKGKKLIIGKDTNINTLHEKNQRKGIKGDWSLWRKIINKKIKTDELNRFYLEKTTRSGATTNLILETIEMKKKLLIIAPTIRICEITVNEAIALSKKEPKLFRLGSNKDLCLKLQKDVIKIKTLNRFPFLFKGYCRNCEYNQYISCAKHEIHDKKCEDCQDIHKNREKCNWRRAIEDIEDYDIIYITTAKLQALSQNEDPEAKKILKNIFNTIKIVFLDELSELLNVGSTNITFSTKPDPIYPEDEDVKKIDFYSDFIDEYEIVRNYVEAQLNEEQKILWYSLYDFIKGIKDFFKKWKTLKESKLIKLNSPLYKVIKKLEKGDSDWVKIYKILVEYTKETNDYPEPIIKLLLLAKHKQFYIQNTHPVNYLSKIDIYPAKPLNKFLDFVNELSKKKTFFTTDASEPPIAVNKMFPNIIKILVNDPMDTAEKQTVFPFYRTIDISRPNLFLMRLPQIINYIEKYGNKNTMIICQNSFTSRKIREELKKNNMKEKYSLITYFRSKYTIGTPSKYRRIITIGSPYPPKDSKRWMADLFIKEGLVNIEEFDIESLTRHLEYYNAKSVFFQAISRAKDPFGLIQSRIYCFGLNKHQIRQFLNFPVAIPKISRKALRV